MKKVLYLFIVLAIILTMSNCDNKTEEQEIGPFSLIGTWEASGEIVVNGDQRTYKCTITFTETEYTEITESKSTQGAFHLTDTYSGTYMRDEERITGTYSYSGDYHNGNPPSVGGPFNWSNTYNFINKNTLEFKGPGAQSMNNYISGNLVYNRKN